MNKNQILVGGEYAQSRSTDYLRYASDVFRVKVIEAADHKTGYPSYTTVPGVLVQLLDRETGEPAVRDGEVVKPFTVANRSIKQAWDSYVEAFTDQREQDARRKDAQDAAQRERGERWSVVLDAFRAKVPGDSLAGVGLSSFEEKGLRAGARLNITLNVETLAALLDVELPS